ncbi:MAG: AAA family ATPase [Sphingopyxis sp.]|uniref:AAA family ATPase n=1 Tax=Sphingopyxis sp. TaxID=1908224 RepID=UPI002ABC6E96|nr:AAA family ATPase [Sphingopyxis sp.]MDZ3833359.1 AAA family ATPase [Sphingopyxis sp.]
MKLKTAYARFYKSFNFDHARKLDDRVEKQPWEMFREHFYPYVTVELDPRITTIVGANESGKSHLIGVIKKAITGEEIEQRDLCRYSPFFGVALGQRCWPHVGVGWDELSESEARAIAEVLETGDAKFRRFLMFREEPARLIVWTPSGKTFVKHELSEEKSLELERLVPRPFEIDSKVALPNSVPFSFLAEEGNALAATYSRSTMEEFVNALGSVKSFLGSDAAVQQNAGRIVGALSNFAEPMEAHVKEEELKSLKLGRSLLLTLGEIDPNSLAELSHGIDQQYDGYVGGLLEAVNQQLESKLNFRRYWVQDRDFSLKVATRDRELVFVIGDRTGTVYTFSERSSGLRYFLSYLIQTQIHRPSSGRESILLMDEPDTFLSAEAQQDLMRVFRDLAEPESGDPIQVLYVTHSPFLLDKNHSERIRVLEKGSGFDGTRVVPSVSRNHYEPLRSAFGAFVGESAFVGSVNLLVEGAADQIILAGAANLIRLNNPGILDETLDLNRMVIVPSGSAQEVGYTVFRIRGQGADKPPVVALLDGDDEGTSAKADFISDKRLRKLIKPENILDLQQLGETVPDWPASPALEDLVPVPLAHRAMELVIEEVTKFREGDPPRIAFGAVQAEVEKGGALLDAINRVVKRHKGRIDKIAFAKALVEACNYPDAKMRPHVDLFLDRMRIIFREVNEAVRRATDDAANKKLETLVAERAALFKVDNPHYATREQASIALRQIETLLDDSPEAEAIRNAMVPIRRGHQLNQEPAARIADYRSFIEQLEGLKHAWRAQLNGAQRPADMPAASLAKASKPAGASRAAAKSVSSGKARKGRSNGATPTESEAS